MKVVEIKLRTPGIFLSKAGAYDTPPTLTLQLKDVRSVSEDFVDVNDYPGITVVSSTIDFSGSAVTGSLPTSSVDVPRQDEGTRRFQLLVPDNRAWEYRIVANPCIDCRRIFESQGQSGKVLNDGSVVVGTGIIRS